MTVRLRYEVENRNMMPTCGVDKGRVELLGQKRVGHVPEELLQQRSYIVNAVVLVQLDVDATIELFTQLKRSSHKEKENMRTRKHNGCTLLMSVLRAASFTIMHFSRHPLTFGRHPGRPKAY